MRSARAPEKRGGFNKGIIFSLVIITVIAIVAVGYFTSGFSSPSAKSDIAPDTGAVSQKLSASSAEAAEHQQAKPKPAAVVAQETPKPRTSPAFLPQTGFGKPLWEGQSTVLDLHLGDRSNSWYTLESDSSKLKPNTLFFALFDDSWEVMQSTVKVEEYVQDSPLQNIELTLYYPEGPSRVLKFDRAEGSLTITKQHRVHEAPSVFTEGVRSKLTQEALTLADGSALTKLELDLDPTSWTAGRSELVSMLAPEVVEGVFKEIQYVIDQIEDRHPE